MLCFFSACHKDDIGQACPQLLETDAATIPTADPTTSETREIVAQDPSFPCDQLLCVTSAGIDGYCSKPCAADQNCPSGFVCHSFPGEGPFKGQKFCVWKPCQKVSDCGPEDKFCCNLVSDANPNQEYRLCAFTTDGHCTGP